MPEQPSTLLSVWHKSTHFKCLHPSTTVSVHILKLLSSQEAFIILISSTCSVFRDESDVPVFSLSDQRSVVLEVTVTNMPSDPENPQKDGDDAHAAQLLVSLPNTLSYSGLMGQQVCLCL